MSRLTRTYATGQTLSIAAMEEASRFRVHEVDIEHLFLALVISEQTAGQVLRGAGITLDAARAAVAEQHAAQIASLGIAARLPANGPIAIHESGHREWTERAIDVIVRSSPRNTSGDASPILRALVTEPSGMIEEILARLGTTPEAVIARLDDAEKIIEPRETNARARLARTGTAFVPATPDAVWELLTTPDRLPEWDTTVGRVEGDGDAWTAWARTEHPDGTAIRVKPHLARQRAEDRADESARRVLWRFTFPDAPRANARIIDIAIESAAGGSELAITVGWECTARPAGLRRVIAPVARRVLAPLRRWALWMQHQSVAAGISRALRG
ncbi:SRPBCC family protein [Microbacterium karelineae]|uniref:SRPBCC family protein n=1 Tax=Microbacterium karelineae TaxID=2654283 RepID=UPI0012EA8C93|nr:SRPBCC family protein [Microbacterium karelineae]